MSGSLLLSELIAEHFSEPTPTDVLSFPIDGVEPVVGRELGDVVICPEHTVDLREAIVHGVLHLVGMDHETDDGEMLALQRELLALGEPATRSGFVFLAGRPNVGKSTLVNVVVGEKVAIVSDRPQTTRRAIRGVHSSGDCQMVLVDLPGVQRPRDALTARMARRVQQELEGSDAALLMLNAEQGAGPATDSSRARSRARTRLVTIAVNKVDRLSRAAIVVMLQQAAELEVGEEVFPISARTGAGVEALVEHLAAR